MEERIEKLENIKKISQIILMALGFLMSPLSALGKWVGLPWPFTAAVLILATISAIGIFTCASIKLDRKNSLLFLKISAMAITGFILWTWLVVSFIPRVMR